MEWDLYSLYTNFFGASVLIAPEYLLVTILIAFGLYLWRRPKGGFWAWILPAKIYRDPSLWVDTKLFLLGRFLNLFGVFNRIALTTAIAVLISRMIGGETAPIATLTPWLSAILIFTINDFISYWLHRILHEHPYLWRLHMLHHSAEVLTPITAYRQHPLSDILIVFAQSAAFGLAQGIFIAFFAREMGLGQLAGVNIFFFVFAMFTANFRHSHIWISFGPVLERLLISPAQHQIHHSIAPEHRDKNFGENFAIWDWMFGSLYVPARHEILTLGLVDQSNRKMDQRYTGLGRALVLPITDMVELWRANRGQSSEKSREPDA